MNLYFRLTFHLGAFKKLKQLMLEKRLKLSSPLLPKEVTKIF